MVKDVFEVILTNFDKLIEECSRRFDKLQTTEDLYNLSIKELMDDVEFSNTEVGRQDKVASEYYHILGMGKLTAIQQTQLTGRFAKYMSYRPDMKAIKTITNFSDIAEIPATTKYKCSVLGNVTLTGTRTFSRAVIEVEEEAPDKKELKDFKPTSEITIKENYKDGAAIIFTEATLPRVLRSLQKSGLSAQNHSKLQSKVLNSGKIQNASYRCYCEREDQLCILYCDFNDLLSKKFFEDYVKYLSSDRNSGNEALIYGFR